MEIRSRRLCGGPVQYINSANALTFMANALLLWVDDEIELLRPHILFLEKKGYEVDTVSNGFDALDHCAERAYDLGEIRRWLAEDRFEVLAVLDETGRRPVGEHDERALFVCKKHGTQFQDA